MVCTLVFLTPSGGLIAVVAAIPLGAVALAARRERQGRELLQLPAPPPASRLPRVLGLVAVFALLGLAAMQPALRTTTAKRVRTDAQAYFIFDTSGSMDASKGPATLTRLQRAKRIAITLRNAIGNVPAGVATVTDRLVPNLLTGLNADPATFDSTVLKAVQIESPPPTATASVATQLQAIGDVATQNFFPATATRRLAVVLTDGETKGVNEAQLAHELARGSGVRLILIHVSAPGELVYGPNGPVTGYHPIPGSSAKLDQIAAAAGGKVFSEGSLGGAIGAEKAALGSGPTVAVGVSEHTRTLAPYLALAALIPLLFLLRPGSLFGRPGGGRRLPSLEDGLIRRSQRRGKLAGAEPSSL
jgi:hypothetical protein